MFGGDRDLDTICAISTPSGVGGISVIRVSGPQAVKNVRKISSLPENIISHQAYLSKIFSFTDESPIDEVVILVFLNSKSFTGEEVVEISCHGSPTITTWIMQELILSGCRTADPGEFSYRAFSNGKLDLVQAESVLSLIESQSKQAAKQAFRQLRGDLSKNLVEIEDIIIWVLANIEASIDFSTEDIDVLDNDLLQSKIDTVINRIDKLIGSYNDGRTVNEGLKIVFSGQPNVGKSSIFNLLAGEDRAIVTDIAGTTRDLVEYSTQISGIKVLMVDTAGLHESLDKVEKIGIERSKSSQKDADLNFFVFDIKKGLSTEELLLLQEINPQTLYLIGNKADLLEKEFDKSLDQLKLKLAKDLNQCYFKSQNSFEEFLKSRIFFISTFENKHKDEILKIISSYLKSRNIEDKTHIFHVRHYEELVKALPLLKSGLALILKKESPDFIALEIKEALLCIQNILGKRFDDDILDRVFKEFCLGK
jgi:tRNA modification GTPase